MSAHLKKSDLVSALAEKANVTKAAATAVLSALTDVVSEALANDGSRVQLSGLGTFSVRNRKARNGVNPATGAKIQIPAKRVAAFKASSTLASRVR
jgi:DNA-binding protein HU-beta